jgi:RES domain-containing protein
LRFEGLVYRAHNPRWAFAPGSGEGAARFGGRFNPKGVPALYTSLRLETAWLEAQQGFAFKAQPMTMVSYEVDCADVADLTDPAFRSELGCAWEDLASRKLPVPSWQVAERLRAEGHAAAVVPSFAARARVDDVNLVFWRWGEEMPHLVRAIDAHGRLPKDDISWR